MRVVIFAALAPFAAGAIFAVWVAVGYPIALAGLWLGLPRDTAIEAARVISLLMVSGAAIACMTQGERSSGP